MAVFVYGLVFYPFLACICHNSVLGIVMGTVYIWFVTAVNIYNLAACSNHLKMTSYQGFVLVLGFLPLLMVCLILSMALPIRFVQMLINQDFNWMEEKPEILKVSTTYVRLLLERGQEIKPEELRGLEKIKHNLGLHTLKKYTGIQYPTFFLCSVFCCVFLLYFILYQMTLLLALADIYINVDLQSEIATSVNTSTFTVKIKDISVPFTANLTSLKLYIDKGFGILKFSSIAVRISLYLSTIISLSHIPFILINYKFNMIEMYNGRYSQVNRRKLVYNSNAKLLLGYSQFAGYQVAYFLWGFLVLTAAIVVFLVVSGLVILFFGEELFKSYWPILLSSIIIYILQHICVKYCFTKDRGGTFAIINRKGYFVWVYFMFFYNIFLGILSVINRTVNNIVFFVIFLPRIDHAVIAKKFELWDYGWMAYQSYLHVQHQHSNPIMLLFIHYLKEDNRQLQRQYDSDSDKEDSEDSEDSDVSKDENESNVFKGGKGGTNDDNEELSEELIKNLKLQRKRAVIFQWFVMYTLINNPSLIIFRKYNMDSRNKRINQRAKAKAKKRRKKQQQNKNLKQKPK